MFVCCPFAVTQKLATPVPPQVVISTGSGFCGQRFKGEPTINVTAFEVTAGHPFDKTAWNIFPFSFDPTLVIV
jgi:hypothetical protein